MSDVHKTLRIRFDSDVPESAIEFSTSAFETIQRSWLGPGAEMAVEVPSGEVVLVYVRTASGATATIPAGPTVDDVVITREMLGLQATPRFQVRKVGHAAPEAELEMSGSASGSASASGTLSVRTDGVPGRIDQFRLSLVDGDGNEIGEARETQDGLERVYTLATMYETQGCDLRIAEASDERRVLQVRLPSSLVHLRVQVDGDDGTLSLNVKAATSSSTADALSTFLGQGDLLTAEGMVEWAGQKAEDALNAKHSNPSAAAAGAYLLLRMRRFDLMRDWARNLADRYPEFPDGSVIWASQLIAQGRGKEGAEDYLMRAAEAPVLPVFSEGVRLLTDGLRLLGENGREPLAAIEERLGVVVWTSPFTAHYPNALGPASHVQIGYATERVHVESTALETIGYDPDSHVLEVAFDSGAVYAYRGVEPEVFTAFQEAESAGGFFNQTIRPAGYESERLL